MYNLCIYLYTYQQILIRTVELFNILSAVLLNPRTHCRTAAAAADNWVNVCSVYTNTNCQYILNLFSLHSSKYYLITNFQLHIYTAKTYNL